MFVWFLKEKGLISAEIFSLRELKGILHNFDEPKMQKLARSKGVLRVERKGTLTACVFLQLTADEIAIVEERS
jgi:hypothetical protein